MKSISFKKFLFLPLFFLMIFSSCQEEATEITDPNNEETLVADSNLANLIRFTVTNDGSGDNIIDFANCLEVQLPVTVIVNGITITINSFEDLDLIEAIFDEFENDENDIEIVFPIIIISNDYTEIVIESQEELEQLIEECNGENEEDEDIECIDFQYPITISIYNTEFEVIDTVTINDDEALYHFIDGLEGGVLASLNFPVTMVLSDDSTLVVENNAELEAAIETAMNDCDEDDDNDWDDDDVQDCNIDLGGLEGYLLECGLVASIYDINGDIFDVNYLDFNLNDELIANGTPTVTETGTWSLTETADGYVLTIDGLETFGLINGEWLLEGCDDDGFVWIHLVTIEQFTMVLSQDCIDIPDCGNVDVVASLIECFWYADNSLFNIFVPEEVYFLSDGTVEVYNSISNELTTTGIWSISNTGSGSLYLNLEFNTEPFSLLNGSWEMIICAEDRFEFVNGDNTLTLGQICESDELPFDCFSNAAFTMCDGETDDNMAEFDLESLYLGTIICPVDFSASFHETGSDAETNSNPIATPSSYTNTANPQTIYVRIEADNGEYMIYEIQLFVEACGGSCNEEDVDAFLDSCIWNVVNYNGSGDLLVWEFDFSSDGLVIITGEGMTLTAMWSTSMSGAGVIVSFTGVALPDIQAVEGEWLVVECEEGRLQFTNNAGDVLIMERDCS